MIFTGQIKALTAASGALLQGCDKIADLNSLGYNEYYSFSLRIYNDSGVPFGWRTARVTVNGREVEAWGSGRVESGQVTELDVSRKNMQSCLHLRVNVAVWYMDGREVHRERFLFTRDMSWSSVFELPSGLQIHRYNKTAKRRSPYISAWFIMPDDVRYTEYTIDFKADHVPEGTYCSLCNWLVDYSPLKRRYARVWTDSPHINAYAGFQRRGDGSRVSIMSFWDVFCRDCAGRQTRIRAKRVYPSYTAETDSFTGEGTGAHCFIPYGWEPKHWYRMYLKCAASPETGNTMAEQWVCDLETGQYTLLCRYDLGVPDVTFKSAAVFLENFMPEKAGDVRSMEVCNARYKDAKTKRWVSLTKAYIASNGGLPDYEGSYSFGAEGDRFWMITSGVGGDWFGNGKGKKADTLAVKQD